MVFAPLDLESERSRDERDIEKSEGPSSEATETSFQTSSPLAAIVIDAGVVDAGGAA